MDLRRGLLRGAFSVASIGVLLRLYIQWMSLYSSNSATTLNIVSTVRVCFSHLLADYYFKGVEWFFVFDNCRSRYLLMVVSLSTLFFNVLKLKGFFRVASAPNAFAVLRWLTGILTSAPEIASIGILGSMRFNSKINSTPSVPGITISVMTRSISRQCSWYCVSPEAPSLASMIWWWFRVRNSVIRVRMLVSSSTISIVAIGVSRLVTIAQIYCKYLNHHST